MPSTVDAARALLDHLVTDPDGAPIGRVDDIELRQPAPGGAPVVTALLCGPLALGPRLGGRLGTWWLSVGRRLRPEADPQPVRVGLELVVGVRPGEVRIGARAEDLDATRSRDWFRDKVVAPVPGGGSAP
ncbi:MAG: hypothetical protein ACJ735_06275 [Actinomycetes bacterium]